MKLSKTSTLIAGLFLGTSLLAANAFADPEHRVKHKEHKIIKVLSEQDNGVSVVIRENGDVNDYDFSFEELEAMDNIEAELGDLDEATRSKVMNLLSQLKSHDAKVIELKDGAFNLGDEETEIFVVKTGDEDEMHIEIDVEGVGAEGGRGVHVAKFLAEGEGPRHVFRHHIKKEKHKKHMAKMLKRMIKKAELSDKEVQELKALLDEKETIEKN